MKLFSVCGKCVAWVFLVSFIYAFQIGPFDLAASTAKNRPRMITANEIPESGSFEKPDKTQTIAKKKCILVPVILGVVAAGAIAVVLVLVVFKSDYNIVGTWKMHESWSDNTENDVFWIFQGSKESGTVWRESVNSPYDNVYRVTGKNVIWEYKGGGYSGTFTSRNKMKGSATGFLSNQWTAEKILD